MWKLCLPNSNLRNYFIIVYSCCTYFQCTCCETGVAVAISGGRDVGEEGKVRKSLLVPEEFARHSGRIEGEPAGDTAGREVVVQCICGVGEGEHRGSGMDVESLVGRERKQDRSRSRNYVGAIGGSAAFHWGMVSGERRSVVVSRGQSERERMLKGECQTPLTYPASPGYFHILTQIRSFRL